MCSVQYTVQFSVAYSLVDSVVYSVVYSVVEWPVCSALPRPVELRSGRNREETLAQYSTEQYSTV